MEEGNMTLQIGCLHAHSSNISYIEEAFKDFDVSLSHSVDSELIKLLKENVPSEKLAEQVAQQLKEMAQTGVQLILITCTNYIALLEGQIFEMNVPVLKIDTPLFERLVNSPMPIKLLFTNQATVKGTLLRFKHSLAVDADIEVEVIVIPDTFDLFLAGKGIEHDQRIIEYLVAQDLYGYTVAVAQLSMVNAARMYSTITGEEVINPLDSLSEYLQQKLKL